MEQVIKEKRDIINRLINSNPNTGDYDEVRTLSINIEIIKRDIIRIKRNMRIKKIKKLFHAWITK